MNIIVVIDVVYEWECDSVYCLYWLVLVSTTKNVPIATLLYYVTHYAILVVTILCLLLCSIHYTII